MIPLWPSAFLFSTAASWNRMARWHVGWEWVGRLLSLQTDTLRPMCFMVFSLSVQVPQEVRTGADEFIAVPQQVEEKLKVIGNQELWHVVTGGEFSRLEFVVHQVLL